MAYLYYSLLVEGIAVTGSLLPANTSKTWITTKNKFNLSTNHESTCINWLFKVLVKFLHNGNSNHTCPKSRPNCEHIVISMYQAATRPHSQGSGLWMCLKKDVLLEQCTKADTTENFIFYSVIFNSSLSCEVNVCGAWEETMHL